MSGGKAGIGKGFLLVEHNRPDSWGLFELLMSLEEALVEGDTKQWN